MIDQPGELRGRVRRSSIQEVLSDPLLGQGAFVDAEGVEGALQSFGARAGLHPGMVPLAPELGRYLGEEPLEALEGNPLAMFLLGKKIDISIF